MGKKCLGITVLPEYLQYEGVDNVLDRLEKAGVSAVATSPYVAELSADGEGCREPPVDAGAGKVRLLDRTLWGKRELWMKIAPSFVPQQHLYQGLRYQPQSPNQLTQDAGAVVGDFVRAAKARGLQVYFQIQAAIPPGYRVQFGGPTGDDVPLLPNGQPVTGRVDKNATLASPHNLAYLKALTQDLAEQYPELDAIRVDWPEFPPYTFDSLFQDFSPHMETAAGELGFDWQQIRQDCLRLYGFLTEELTEQHLLEFLHENDSQAWQQKLQALPGAGQMLKLKAAVVRRFLGELKSHFVSLRGELRLEPSAFPPPWSYVSGLAFGEINDCCDAVVVKLYSMHWSMMLHFYGTRLNCPRVDESTLVRVLAKILDIEDEPRGTALVDYEYPDPSKTHAYSAEAQRRKIQTAKQLGGNLPVHVFAHGYGPLSDVTNRLKIARDVSTDGVWINRYCYLSDEKLAAIGEVFQGYLQS